MTREVEIRAYIAQRLGTTVPEVNWRAGLDAVGLGSLQFVEIFVDLQEAFGVPLFHDDMDRIDCFDDLVQILNGRIQYGPSFGRARRDTPSEAAAAARA